MITPFVPGFDLDRYDRELRRPFPSDPQLAPESDIWRREHVVAGTTNPPSFMENRYEQYHQSARAI
jgi:hypothetical protein